MMTLIKKSFMKSTICIKTQAFYPKGIMNSFIKN